MASGSVNPELVRERAAASFNIRELTHLLDGGSEKTERRKELGADPAFFCEPRHIRIQNQGHKCYLTYSEAYADALQKCLKIYQKAMVLSDPREILTVADAILHDSTPVHVHFVMFVPALMGHANEEQQAKWLSDALTMKIIGSYAQTELGHGTFIRGLETRATYDPEREEFVLHTPNLSSIKWWPGSLGKTANHAIVLAQLYTKGKCYGIHPFMVQIRSMEDHTPLPGITVGEIGPKMGMRAADNGFLKLDNVRIPRENMLMKNAQVTKEGDYVKPASDKLNYGTMVFVRVLLLDMFAFNIARACTIAVRYSAVRRQSEITPGQGECQILDYQAQQYKLFPLLGLCHALRGMFANLMELYKQANQDLEQGTCRHCLRHVHRAHKKVRSLVSTGLTQEVAWNQSQVDLIIASRATIHYYMGLNYLDWLEHATISEQLRDVLMRVCHLYLLHGIYEQPGLFLVAGLREENLEEMSGIITDLLKSLRPDAVALVDAFDHHDMVLCSALGSYDGRVYERMYESALKAPLNKTQLVQVSLNFKVQSALVLA
ncbi:hypothetical protein HPB50_016713 [Hyalomma asiaticum]|uniref:Uncharacterized protein n=1 Tax=Hyalomma asiaticum TaxID=266040 RepID=A0ACB7S5K6_HYAAI|nr:hypothetical protein HPB50_016713 [Hyalomma asiaticum]